MSVYEKILSRRELLGTIGRGLSLAGLTFGAWKLASGKDEPQANQECVNKGFCRNCRVFKDCGLPRAISAKKGSVRQ